MGGEVISASRDKEPWLEVASAKLEIERRERRQERGQSLNSSLLEANANSVASQPNHFGIRFPHCGYKGNGCINIHLDLV